VRGGFVQKDESGDDAALRVLKNLTGIENVYMEQVHAFGEVERDPGERVISIAYYALLGPEEYDQKLLEIHNAVWTPIDSLPELGFDHPIMVAQALGRIRRQFSTMPIGFNLLPELFTLSQLQTLYETILGEPVDKRNFRKRISETGCIEKTALIDKSGSRRGASLYRFNEKKYNADCKFRI
ncbi:MAG: NUDIX hydrolase, partial [Duncaniella sp.]|nr:NUDIX hydrolase [Duncaniella sp.]